MSIIKRHWIIISSVIILIGVAFVIVVVIHRARPAATNVQPTNQQTGTHQSDSSPKPAGTSTNPLFGVPCKDNAKPVFTHDLTDPTLINFIQPYGLGETTPRFRSFLGINQKKASSVPVYAPVDSDLVEATYKTARGATDFDIHLTVSCQVWYLVNHITDPVDKIRNVLPSTPAATTADIPKINPPIHFTAGELLGTTSGTPLAHNWDFGVFDLTHENQFVNQARYEADTYNKVLTALCPFDVFPTDIKAAYYTHFGEDGVIVPNAPCGPISPDKIGTISGSWFSNEKPSQDPAQHSLRFALMIGKYIDGVVRITGEDYQQKVEIAPANKTYIDPLAVTDRHCYASSGKVVDFKVISDSEIRVYSGSGSCTTVFTSSGFKTYYR